MARASARAAISASSVNTKSNAMTPRGRASTSGTAQESTTTSTLATATALHDGEQVAQRDVAPPARVQAERDEDDDLDQDDAPRPSSRIFSAQTGSSSKRKKKAAYQASATSPASIRTLASQCRIGAASDIEGRVRRPRMPRRRRPEPRRRRAQVARTRRSHPPAPRALLGRDVSLDARRETRRRSRPSRMSVSSTAPMRPANPV